MDDRPLSWCLLADMCNHTWIPECGNDVLLVQHKLFTDECDMIEHNCDREMDYELVNYSDCLAGNVHPSTVPCPYKCYTDAPKSTGKTTKSTKLSKGGRRMFGFEIAPLQLMTGKRRYTPTKYKKNHFRTSRTTQKVVRPRHPPYQQRRSKTTTAEMITEMILLKKETVIRGGKQLVRVVKGIAWKPGKPLQIVEETHEEDFLV